MKSEFSQSIMKYIVERYANHDKKNWIGPNVMRHLIKKSIAHHKKHPDENNTFEWLSFLLTLDKTDVAWAYQKSLNRTEKLWREDPCVWNDLMQVGISLLLPDIFEIDCQLQRKRTGQPQESSILQTLIPVLKHGLIEHSDASQKIVDLFLLAYKCFEDPIPLEILGKFDYLTQNIKNRAAEEKLHLVLDHIHQQSTCPEPSSGAKTIVVSSYMGGAGTSFVAAHLAGGLSASGKKTLLLETNGDNPTFGFIHEAQNPIILDLHRASRLVCLPSEPDAELMQEANESRLSSNLHIIKCTNQIRSRLSSNMQRSAISTIVKCLKDDFDYIVIDSKSMMRHIAEISILVSDCSLKSLSVSLTNSCFFSTHSPHALIINKVDQNQLSTTFEDKSPLLTEPLTWPSMLRHIFGYHDAILRRLPRWDQHFYFPKQKNAPGWVANWLSIVDFKKTKLRCETHDPKKPRIQNRDLNALIEWIQAK